MSASTAISVEDNHARVQTKISATCLVHESDWRLRAVSEQRVQVRPERYRVPGVCLLHRDSPVEQIVTTPPLLCVEVLSPDDRMSEMQERIDDYLAMGVALVWLIDPRKRRAWLHTPEGASEARDALRVPGTPVEVSLSWLFEDLPAR